MTDESGEMYRRIAALGCLLLTACSGGEGPEAVARSFVEHYYIRPDLPKAKALAFGLARRKIEEEQELIRGVVREQGAADRDVSVVLHEARQIGENKIFFVYELGISVDNRILKKRATIAIGKIKEGWVVTNFHETDI